MMGESEEIEVSMPWGPLAVKTWNSRTLEPVLVLHGAGDNAASFDGLIPLLSKQYFYLCVDLPGHGLSASFSKGLPLSFMHHIAALQRLIRYFDWPSFSIMGHSFGGHLSLVLAAAEKNKVKQLILIDGTVRSYLPDETYLSRCIAELEEVLRIEANCRNKSQIVSYDEALEKLINRNFTVTKEAAAAMLKRTLIKTGKGCLSRADPRTCYTNMPHMSDSVHFFNCSLLDFPILIIYAKDSQLFEIHNTFPFHQTVQDILLKSHRLSKVVCVAGNHCVHCNQPQLISPIINKFFSDTNNLLILNEASKL